MIRLNILAGILSIAFFSYTQYHGWSLFSDSGRGASSGSSYSSNSGSRGSWSGGWGGSSGSHK